MNHILIRMGVVIGTLATVQMGLWYVGLVTHPTVVDPRIPITDFPRTINVPTGTWEGKDAQLDARTFNETQAETAVSRSYTKQNLRLSFLLAEYKSPHDGLYHNPMNCYHTHGFTLEDETKLPLQAPNRPDSVLSVSTWSGNGERVIVAYWYEVGDHTMFERQDLLKTQWAMRGKSRWPIMFKVLLEIPAGDSEQSKGEAKAELLGMAQSVRQWLGNAQPVVN